MARFRNYNRLAQDVQEVLDTLVPKEAVVQHQDGAWYQLRIQPYRTVENVIEGAVLTFVDVTEQKALQTALQESQEKLALLFELLPVGVAVLDAEGQTVYANPALETILGISRADLLRGNHLELPYRRPDGKLMPAREAASARVLREQQPVQHVETGITRDDGAVVWVDMSAVPMTLPGWRAVVVTFNLSASRGDRPPEIDRSLMGLLALGERAGEREMAQSDPHREGPEGLRQRADELWRQRTVDRRSSAQPTTDIPLHEALNLLHELEVHQIELEMQNEELRRAQEEIAGSRARYFDLYELAPVGYLTLDEKGLILEANLTAANLLGVERSQLVKRPLFRFIVPDDQDIYYLHRKRLLATLQPQVCELRMVRGRPVPSAPPAQGQNSGDPLWVRLQTSVAQNNADAPVWRVTLSDVTERQRAQEALQRVLDDLDRQVRERTAELRTANAALRLGRDELQSLNHRLVQAQENERAAIARELHDGAGQAMAVVSMGLHVLDRKLKDRPDVAAQIEMLRAAAQVLATELHNVAASLHPDSLSRLGLMPAVREHLSTLQTTEGPQLQFEAAGFGDGRLPAEVELAVYRVIQEAVSNALLHAHAGVIKVVMQMDLGQLVVSIADDGDGFDTQIAAAGRLGLLTMHERIVMLGGRLTINSSPGAGTTVQVEAPLPFTP